MDWPSRSIWSRLVWLRLRLRYWWLGRRKKFAATAEGEPFWWAEFERDFWSHIGARKCRYERDGWRISGDDASFGASLRRVLPRRRRRPGGGRAVP
jgi:hypothetical protein